MHLWNSDGSLFKVLTGHMGRVESVAVLGDGRIISWGAKDFVLRLWSGAGQEMELYTIENALAKYPEWTPYLYSEQVSPNGTYRLQDRGNYCCLSLLDSTDYQELRWHADTKMKVHKVFNDGSAIVSLDSGQVNYLKPVSHITDRSWQ